MNSFPGQIPVWRDFVNPGKQPVKMIPRQEGMLSYNFQVDGIMKIFIDEHFSGNDALIGFGVQHSVSGFPVSSFRFFRFQVSGFFRFQVSGFKFKVLGFKIQVSVLTFDTYACVCSSVGSLFDVKLGILNIQ